MRAIQLCDNCKPDQTIPLCHEYGCGIEIQTFFHPDTLLAPDREIKRHRELLEGISPTSLHGPFGELVAGSFDPLVRDVVSRRYEQTLEIAGQLQISHIVLHHSYQPKTSLPANYTKRFIGFWKEFLSDKPDHLRFHIENVAEPGPDMLLEAIDGIIDNRVDVCLDVGHVNCNADEPISAWVEALGSRIGYVHLHNNHGVSDEHLRLDTGTLDMTETCRLLEEFAPDAIWAIEAETGMEESIRWLAERGYRPGR